MTNDVTLPNNRGNLRIVANGEALATAAAQLLQETANRAIAERGRALIALSGGSTPKRMGELLAAAPYRDEMPWGNIIFFWGDERWAPLESPESNAGTALRVFLSDVDVPAGNIHTVETGQDSPDEAAAAYERTIRTVTGQSDGYPAFDLVLLGMGDDGHTASLFPHTGALDRTDALVVANHVPKLNADRITFTYPMINAARKVAFLIGGSGKATVLERVLEGPREPAEYPSQGIHPASGSLLWLVDRDASARLNATGATN